MSFRLSPLIIFLILLGVLLIGYMMGHVWENFCDSYKEGFENDVHSGLIHVNGYSTASSKIVPLLLGVLYFDPVHRALVNTPPGFELFIKSSSGKLLTSDSNSGATSNSFNLVDAGFGYVSVENSIPLELEYGPSIITTLKGAMEYFENLKGDAIFMDVTFAAATADPVSDTVLLGKYEEGPSGVRIFSSHMYPVDTTGDSYPSFTPESVDTSYMFRRFYRVMESTNTSFNVTDIPDGTAVNYTFTTQKEQRYGVVHIPVPSSGVTFLHIIDFSTKQHVQTYFFNSITKETTSYLHASDIISKQMTNAPNSLSGINGTGITPRSINLRDIDFDVRTTFFPEENVIHLVGSKVDGVGHTSFYAILSFTSNTEIKINYSSTKVGDAFIGIATDDGATGFGTTGFGAEYDRTTPKYNSGTTPSPTSNSGSTSSTSNSGSTSSSSTNNFGSSPTSSSTSNFGSTPTPTSTSGPSNYGDLLNTTNNLSNLDDSMMDRIKLLKSLFGGASSDDYILKTEVIPPVCPNCPSCKKEDGVCTDCGGTGGSGTSGQTPLPTPTSNNSSDPSLTGLAQNLGTGATNLIRDGAEGAADLLRDGAGGAVHLAEETAAGVEDAVEDTAVGAGVAVLGAYALGRDAVGGVYGAASDAVKGTVGLLDGNGNNNNNNGSGNNGVGGGVNTATSPQQQQQQQQQQQTLSPGQDPYSYFGAVPVRNQGSSNFVPRLADFSHFGK